MREGAARGANRGMRARANHDVVARIWERGSGEIGTVENLTVCVCVYVGETRAQRNGELPWWWW